ncbi:MAG: hypothetical protein AAFU72_08100, partial [Pseudomonadota bacterium]
MKDTANKDAPAIRTFQFAGVPKGVVGSDVNQFRGDVNMTQPLFTLPGRGQGSGLDVTVSLQYQSNVFEDGQTRNLEAPTGVLGLGWTLPLSRIEAADTQSAAPAAQRYTLHDSGVSSALERQAVAPVVMSLERRLASGLTDGSTVTSDLRAAFLNHGLALSAGTQVTGNGPWTLTDSKLEQIYTAETEKGALLIRDGGEFYQLKSYKFWKVIHYPAFARWVVVTDKAVRRSFGGGVGMSSAGVASSAGNSVAWSVWWTGAGGAPAWTGPSASTKGQIQRPRAWYLHSVTDRFGGRVTYDYNGFDRDSDGLIPGCEQRVGAGGAAYTKAVYLTAVTDVFGRKASFAYGEKLWGAGESDPREYADPHLETPSNDPGPWQDRYETRYLQEIAVTDSEGGPLFSVEMGYAPRPEAGEAHAVANVTEATGALEGDTYKRFLTSITQVTREGGRLPGFLFAYDLDPDPSKGQPGALSAATWPEGAVVSYIYEQQDLSICQRTEALTVPSGSTPRIFYGPDYSVFCTYRAQDETLSMQVKTWTGAWLTWQPSWGAVLDTGGADLTTLEVVAEQDFLIVTFYSPSAGERRVYAFSRDEAKPGQWRPAAIDGTTTAKDVPSLSYKGSPAEVSFAAGDRFFLAATLDQNSGAGQYDVLTWRWSDRSWSRETVKVGNWVWLAARHEYYVILDAKTSKATLHALDGALTWGESAAVTLDGLVTADLDGVAFETGSAMIAIANRTAHNAQSQTTALWALAWSADYAATATKLGTVTDNQPQGSGVTPLSWVPQVVDDGIVALNAHLFRFDGVTWVADSSLDPGVPDQGVQPRYAYGPGYALQTMTPVAGMGQITAKAISVAAGGGWNKPGGQTLPPPNSLVPAEKAGVASAGGADWAVLGPLAFNRGTSTDWGKIVAATPTADLQADFAGDDGFLSTTIVNEGPSYLAFGLASGAGGRPVQALLLKNGKVKKADHSFSKQSLLPGGRGQAAAGPSQFATFDAAVGSFETTPTLYLNRYAGQDVSGPIRHHTVTAATMTDGFGGVSQTLFRPDTDTAACDPTGKVVKFYETNVYPDTEDTKDPRNGWTRTTYLNGLKDVTGADFWNMLDGLKLSTAVYDARGAEKSSSTTVWRVVDEVGSDPTDPDGAPVALRGGWVFQAGKSSVTDGVARQTETGFVSPGCKLAVSGQAITKIVHSWSGAGVAEQFVTTRALAAATSPAIRAIHSLTEPAHTEDSHVSGGTTRLTGATATTYTDWATAFDDPVRAPAQAAGYKLRHGDAPAFDHAESEAPREGWLLVSKTT